MKRLILLAIMIIVTNDIYSQNQTNSKTMKTAKELMQDYHRLIQNPDSLGALFTKDGAIELPYLASIGLGWRTEGPENIKNMIAGILKMAPEFKFVNIKFYIETPDQVYAEYEVDCIMRIIELLIQL